jgi:hypothetical protein
VNGQIISWMRRRSVSSKRSAMFPTSSQHLLGRPAAANPRGGPLLQSEVRGSVDSAGRRQLVLLKLKSLVRCAGRSCSPTKEPSARSAARRLSSGEIGDDDGYCSRRGSRRRATPAFWRWLSGKSAGCGRFPLALD